MRIHSRLGKGFKEVVYKDAMEVEFINDIVPYEREKKFKIEYGNIILPHGFDADYVVFKSIILEVKATPFFLPAHFSQTLNYLKASQIKLGILINSGEDKLQFKRIVCTY